MTEPEPFRAEIVVAELRRRRLPAPLSGFGPTMIGPTLLQFGTDEQRREHLPKIVRGEIRWAQGYSEPNAGSDLASLAASARIVGDDIVLDGQKVWTSYADKADWMFGIFRTHQRDPAQHHRQARARPARLSCVLRSIHEDRAQVQIPVVPEKMPG